MAECTQALLSKGNINENLYIFIPSGRDPLGPPRTYDVVADAAVAAVVGAVGAVAAVVPIASIVVTDVDAVVANVKAVNNWGRLERLLQLILLLLLLLMLLENSFLLNIYFTKISCSLP